MRAALLVLTVALAATSIYLYTENRRLHAQLALPRVQPASAPAPTEALTEATAAPARAQRGQSRGALALLRALTAPPADPDAPAPNDEARRARRQQNLRQWFGRGEGETVEEYSSRIGVIIGTALLRPRRRVEDQRQEFEAAAQLSAEQKAELDGALDEARTELLGLASKAITDGDLTPYRRNTAGVLRFVASATGVVDGFDARLRQAISADQASFLDQTGFDPIEYLGLTTPWEHVTPPPPAPPPL